MRRNLEGSDYQLGLKKKKNLPKRGSPNKIIYLFGRKSGNNPVAQLKPF